MAYNQENAERVRQALTGLAVEEKRMFGSLGFMVNSKLALCVKEHDMMFKLSQNDYNEALADNSARPMIHANRIMKQWVFVENDKLEDPVSFGKWLKAALKYNQIVKQTSE